MKERDVDEQEMDKVLLQNGNGNESPLPRPSPLQAVTSIY